MSENKVDDEEKGHTTSAAINDWPHTGKDNNKQNKFVPKHKVIAASTHSSSDEHEGHGAWGDNSSWGESHSSRLASGDQGQAILTGRQRKKFAGIVNY